MRQTTKWSIIGCIFLIMVTMTAELIEHILHNHPLFIHLDWHFYFPVIIGGFIGIVIGYIYGLEAERREKLNRTLAIKRVEFVSIASHELRTPLTIIKGTFDHLEKMHEEKCPNGICLVGIDYKKSFKLIERNIARMNRLIRDVSAFSKIERGVFKLNKETIDIFEFTRLHLTGYQKMLGDQLIFTEDLKKESLSIAMDMDRIGQVFDNIIYNAIKHTHTKSRRIYISISDFLPNKIQIKIVDNGAGIKKENLEAIFKPFIAYGSKYKIAGTGMGLFISREIINGHKGKIWAHSEGIGTGSTIIIELPKG